MHQDFYEDFQRVDLDLDLIWIWLGLIGIWLDFASIWFDFGWIWLDLACFRLDLGLISAGLCYATPGAPLGSLWTASIKRSTAPCLAFANSIRKFML